MGARYLLSIDAGTSGVRCLITDIRGKPVGLEQKGWKYESPPDIAPLGREFSAGTFWKAVCECIQLAARNGNVQPGDVASVSAASQREGAVFLDREGTELYAGPNIDLRALFQGLALDDDFGQDIYSITGHKPSFMFVPAKLKWFEQNRPDVHARIATVLAISDWVLYRLSGERTSEVTAASELGLIDITSRVWSEKLSRLLSLPRGICPALVDEAHVIGRITGQAARDTGLAEGTPVVSGGADTQMGLLGMGLSKDGETGVVSGWSAPVQMVTEKAVFDPRRRIWTSCHAFPGKWILESNAGEAGNAYRWLADTMFGGNGASAEEVYGIMDGLAEDCQGDCGVMAFLGPGVMDMNRLGLRMGGFFFPVPLSAGEVQRSQLVKAALDNICFAVKANLWQLEDVSGIRSAGLSIGGGLAASRYLVKTLPSVLNLPVFVPELKQVSALGAAMSAAAGAGVWSSLDEAVSAMKPAMEVMQPDRAKVSEYSEYYDRWVSTAQHLERLSEGLV